MGIIGIIVMIVMIVIAAIIEIIVIIATIVKSSNNSSSYVTSLPRFQCESVASEELLPVPAELRREALVRFSGDLAFRKWAVKFLIAVQECSGDIIQIYLCTYICLRFQVVSGLGQGDVS